MCLFKDFPKQCHCEGEIESNHPLEHIEPSIMLGQFMFKAAHICFGGGVVVNGSRQRLAQRLRLSPSLRVGNASSLKLVNVFQSVKGNRAHAANSSTLQMRPTSPITSKM